MEFFYRPEVKNERELLLEVKTWKPFIKQVGERGMGGYEKLDSSYKIRELNEIIIFCENF